MKLSIQTYLILLLFFSFLSCSEKLPYKTRLLNYLNDIHFVSIKDETLLILINGYCGSCDDKTINLIQEISKCEKFKNVKKIVILSSLHHAIYDKINNSEFQILIDPEYYLSRYGLDFGNNIIVHFKNDKIIQYWNWLYLNEIYNVSEKYGLKDC